MEGRTLIDEMYAAIRSGPHYRKQRLDLARNASVAVRKHAERPEPPVLSILLADTNGARYPALLDALPVERGRLEVILCDVFDREAAIHAGGLEESAYYAGSYSGPYELVDRLRGQRWTVETLEALPAAQNTRLGETALPVLFEQVWPTKFSPYRVMPLRENPEIAALRQKLR